jgi:hypothetical protein
MPSASLPSPWERRSEKIAMTMYAADRIATTVLMERATKRRMILP